MIGEPLSRAASREATTVEEEVTFCWVLSDGGNGEQLYWEQRTMAGTANLCSCAYLKRAVNRLAVGQQI